jgi:excisionase family DNA binding protein
MPENATDAGEWRLITTVEAAKRLGVSRPRIQQYITKGRLKARKIGRDLFIDERDLATFKRRDPGRPSTKADGTPGDQVISAGQP